METTIAPDLDFLDNLPSVSLSIPLIASYLRNGVRQCDIAKACNVSKQAVNDYIKRHYDALGPLVERDDGILAMSCKHVANKALLKLDQHLDSATKRDLVVLSTIAGTQIDKYRLLNNQSTSNVAINQAVTELDKSLSETRARMQQLAQELGIVDNEPT